MWTLGLARRGRTTHSPIAAPAGLMVMVPLLLLLLTEARLQITIYAGSGTGVLKARLLSGQAWDITKTDFATAKCVWTENHRQVTADCGNNVPPAYRALSITVDLHNLHITSIEPGAFEPLVQMGFIHIKKMKLAGGSTAASVNRLTKLESHTFRGLTALENLYLNGNQLAHIAADAFSDLVSLTYLNLSGNMVAELVDNTFRGLDKVKTLFLTGNALMRLPPDSFSGLRSVTTLAVKGNPLSMLSENCFRGLDSLEHIDLEQSVDIAHIAPGAFNAIDFRQIKYWKMSPTDFGACCTLDATLPGLACSCGPDPFAPNYPHDKVPGGENLQCVCPQGQYTRQNFTRGLSMCVPCDRGTYNSVQNELKCQPCAADYITTNVGSTSLADCTLDPKVRSARAQEAARIAQEASKTAQEAAKVALEAAKNDLEAEDLAKMRLFIAICGLVAMVLAVVLTTACYWHRNNLLHTIRDQELREQEFLLLAKEQEVAYYRDWRIKEQDLEFEDGVAWSDDAKVAAGAEGTVFKARLWGEIVAVKRSRYETAEHVWNEAEVAVMMCLKHERIVTFIGAGSCYDENNLGYVTICVQEYMDGTSLDKRLWGTDRESVTWLEKMRWAIDIAEGMDVIHSKGFAHRDLKSQNILYDIRTGHAKVADFGLSCVFQLRNHAHVAEGFEGLVGTLEYLAPELFPESGLPEVDKASATADTYAFGVIMSEFCTHQRPWHQGEFLSDDRFELISQAVSTGLRPTCDGPAPGGWSALMQECWAQDPNERPPRFDIIWDQLRGLGSGLQGGEEWRVDDGVGDSYATHIRRRTTQACQLMGPRRTTSAIRAIGHGTPQRAYRHNDHAASQGVPTMQSPSPIPMDVEVARTDTTGERWVKIV